MHIRLMVIVLAGTALVAAQTAAQDIQAPNGIAEQETVQRAMRLAEEEIERQVAELQKNFDVQLAQQETVQRAMRLAELEVKRQVAELRKNLDVQREQLEIVRRQLLEQRLPIFPAVPAPPDLPALPDFPAPPDLPDLSDLSSLPGFSVEQRGEAAQTERFSRKIKLGRNGSVSVSNVSGEIVVTTGSGDEVSIEATKWTNGDRSRLAEVQIQVDERPDRIDVRANSSRRTFNGFNERVSVDYAVTVPSWAAVDVHSVSGTVRVTGVQGAVRAETVSGSITTSATPRLELAKTVSGNIELTGAAANGDLVASTVSGHVRAKGLKSRSLDIQTVSGNVSLTEMMCDRLDARTVSGSMEYSGALVGGGRYDVNSYSGTVRFVPSSDTGFELNADTFSGAIRSDIPLTIGAGTVRGDVRQRGGNRSLHGISGNGSAILTIRTFSGAIVIAKSGER